jgi:hypothetical protein
VEPGELIVGYKLICEKCGHEQTFDWELFKGCGAELIVRAAELLTEGELKPNWVERRDQWLKDAGMVDKP